jgi:hypothetical protein
MTNMTKDQVRERLEEEARQGGAGAQSGQADFGSAGNLAGMRRPGKLELSGSSPR